MRRAGIRLGLAALVLCGLSACGNDSTEGTPIGPTASSSTPTQSGSSTMSDCPAPDGSANPVTTPLAYSQTVHLDGGYGVTFAAMDSTRDSSSPVTLKVSRKSEGCTDDTTVQLTEGSSTDALGLHLRLDRVLPSTGGRPPQLTITYSF